MARKQNPSLFDKYPRFEGQRCIDDLKAIPVGISIEQDHFKQALLALYAVAEKDIHWYIIRGYQPKTFSNCMGARIIMRTYLLHRQLDDITLTPEEKLQCVNDYESDCYKITRRHHLIKAVAVVAAAALGFVVGAVIGATIGMVAGIWSGPGAAVTALFGFAMGAAIGVMAASAVVGATTGGLVGFSLFKTNRVMKSNIREVAQAARELPDLTIRAQRA